MYLQGTQQMSNPPCHDFRMKLKFFPLFRTEVEIVASWGEAQLIQYLDGKVELKGGSKEDRLAAHEWISLFCHEAVVGEDSGRGLDCGGRGASSG